MRKGVIYKITFECSSKLYIGSAINFKRRRWDHIKLLRKNKHPNINLQRSFNKYSESSMSFSVLEQGLDEIDLVPREQYWIDQYDFTTELYNLCPIAGSSLGRLVSEETKAKMSQNRGRYCGAENSFYGKTHTDETRERLSTLATGRKQSTETIEKRISSIKEKYGGRHPNSKPVNQIDPNTGEVLKTWANMTEAAKSLGIRVSNISTVCNKIPVYHKAKGKHYVTQTAGGYKWEFWT